MDRDLKMLRSQHILIQRGRGKHSSNDGNKFLESAISDYREEYQLLTPSNTPARTKIVDAIVDRIQKDNRRFLTRTIKNEWVEAQNNSIRDLIRRKLNAPGQLASLGGIKSTIDATFMLNHPELESDVFEILRSLFDHPSQSPECSGEHGIRLSADSVYGNKPEINTKKKMYLRQSFGKTDCGLPTHNKNTRTTCAYGVGTGVVTHGQIREHVAIRPFTTGMQRIADAIQDYIKTADPGGTVDVERLFFIGISVATKTEDSSTTKIPRNIIHLLAFLLLATIVISKCNYSTNIRQGYLDLKLARCSTSSTEAFSYSTQTMKLIW
jgi:hypothetical protein